MFEKKSVGIRMFKRIGQEFQCSKNFTTSERCGRDVHSTWPELKAS